MKRAIYYQRLPICQISGFGLSLKKTETVFLTLEIIGSKPRLCLAYERSPTACYLKISTAGNYTEKTLWHGSPTAMTLALHCTLIIEDIIK